MNSTGFRALRSSLEPCPIIEIDLCSALTGCLVYQPLDRSRYKLNSKQILSCGGHHKITTCSFPMIATGVGHVSTGHDRATERFTHTHLGFEMHRSNGMDKLFIAATNGWASSLGRIKPDSITTLHFHTGKTCRFDSLSPVDDGNCRGDTLSNLDWIIQAHR